MEKYWILNIRNVRMMNFAIANRSSKRINQSQVLPGLNIYL
ncbi:hypothetical protein RintRC_3412 [Richelia intracellularis]|nr:hypothetical protein RintRC_3412 [Richelia intracellularis]